MSTRREGKNLNFVMLMKFILIISLIYALFSYYSQESYRKLKRLCEMDAQMMVYETVEAQGYYDATTNCHHCWNDLIVFPYTYVEFCDVDSYRNPASYAISDNGCYSLSEITKNEGQCHSGVSLKIARFSSEPFESFKEKSCVKVEKIDGPGSDIGLFVDERATHLGDEFDIHRFEYTVKSLTKTEIYGTLVNYSLNIKTLNGAQYGYSSPKITGKNLSQHNPSLYKSLISQVVISK